MFLNTIFLILNDKMNVMKFSKKKILSLLPIAIIPMPIMVITSCSKNHNFEASSTPDLYTSVLNALQNKLIQGNNFLDLTVAQFEAKINEEIKKDATNDLLMKIYCFYLLWQSIKNPLTESGTTQSNLSTEIQEYATFLENKLSPDDKNIQDKNKKKYTKFKNYLNSFNYQISLFNFNNENNNTEETLLNLFKNGRYVLDFQINFWTTDEETNSKMISKKNNGKSIMFKNTISRPDREIIRKIKDKNLKEIATNQFAYQSTKLYFDLEQKKFSSIILPSNINYVVGYDETPNSGFASGDKTRRLLAFEFYTENNKSKTFSPFINFLLNSSDNFSYSLTSDWTNFLELEKLYITPEGKSSKEMKNIKISLGNSFFYDPYK